MKSANSTAAASVGLPACVVAHAESLDRELVEQTHRVALLQASIASYASALAIGNDTAGMLGIVTTHTASVQAGAVAIEVSRKALATMAEACGKKT